MLAVWLPFDESKSSRPFLRYTRDGVITTDPFKIGEAQAYYYKTLYKSRETDLNAPESKQFFKDTNISKLSNDMRNLCEGEIKMQECENVLHSFAIGKTPGNDGLPIEFYKTFWPTVGKILVQVFNEAYNAKEISNSQKQAVITLIENYRNCLNCVSTAKIFHNVITHNRGTNPVTIMLYYP